MATDREPVRGAILDLLLGQSTDGPLPRPRQPEAAPGSDLLQEDELSNGL